MTDSWQWAGPTSESTMTGTALDLSVEALRRAVDLRDALAQRGEPETTRALKLIDVLNVLCNSLVLDSLIELDVPIEATLAGRSERIAALHAEFGTRATWDLVEALRVAHRI